LAFYLDGEAYDDLTYYNYNKNPLPASLMFCQQFQAEFQNNHYECLPFSQHQAPSFFSSKSPTFNDRVNTKEQENKKNNLKVTVMQKNEMKLKKSIFFLIFYYSFPNDL
jgi:preprotein translocase subunit SecB